MEEILNLSLELCKSSFDLEKVVCNHGFFMMPPNKWIPSTKTLKRPLRIAKQTKTVIVSISQQSRLCLHVSVGLRSSAITLSTTDKDEILEQISRMLRISEKDEKAMEQFHQLHPQAKEKAFGRLFRSPSLFEDAVKSILLCNSTWSGTLDMAKSLCEIPFMLRKLDKKRKRQQRKSTIEDEFDDLRLLGNFPSPKELASFRENELKHYCSVGYRAKYIIKLAKDIEHGNLELNKIEEKCDLWSYKRVYNKLQELEGFGKFTIASFVMCLGCYQQIPIDTETKRHLKEVHGRTTTMKTIQKDVEEIYKKYQPFQCIAYWFELVDYYEKAIGKLSMLSESDYHRITGSILERGNLIITLFK